jgi:hypothetical protein
MIERHWKGICKPAEAANYKEHLLNITFKKLNLISGFVKAKILTRELPDGVEFLIITAWHSMADIRKFAGENAELAVVPREVKEMMISYDAHAAHYKRQV